MKWFDHDLNGSFSSWLICAILVVITSGIVALIEVIFSYGITMVSSLRLSTLPWLWMLGLPLIGVIILILYGKTKMDRIDVMGSLFDIYHYKDQKLPLILIPLAVVSTWLTHLCGGSVGREGVAVQIGGIVGNKMGSIFHGLTIDQKRLIVFSAMSAGFAGLFVTPWTAMFFVLEIAISGMVDTTLLIPCGVSAFIAALVAKACGLSAFRYGLTIGSIDSTMVVKCLIMAMIFGLVGGWFGRGIHFVHDHLIKLFRGNTKKMMVVIASLIAIIMIITNGRYAGLSSGLEQAAFSGDVFWYDAIFKFGLTIVCLGIGLKGGEVAPLFVIGASLGAFLAQLFGLPVSLGAALGYICVFASGTNTLIAPLFLIGESFGFTNLPLLALGVIIAYAFNFNHSIYTHQTTIQHLLDHHD